MARVEGVGERDREWDSAVGAWSRALRAAGRAETTIATRADHVRRLGRGIGCGPWEVDGHRLLAWAAAQSWALETRRSVRASLRGFYGWAVAAGHVDTNVALVLPVVKAGAPNPRPTPEAVYRQALALATPRERLILRLAAQLGMRRGEIAVAHSEDLMDDLLGWSLLVHGKGGRERIVPMPTPLALELRALGPGWFFPGDDHGHLSPRWVGKLASRLLPGAWTIHTLRHRFATLAHEHERDLLVVRDLLGHASVSTTQRYTKVKDGRARATVLAIAG